MPKTDLQKFATLFDAKYIRPIKGALEVRVHNLDAGKHDANKLIERHKLNLEVYTEGSMVVLKSFVVRERAA